jgi:hypothetical protein
MTFDITSTVVEMKIPRGTVLHIHGIPVRLAYDTRVCTGNRELVEDALRDASAPTITTTGAEASDVTT